VVLVEASSYTQAEALRIPNEWYLVNRLVWAVENPTQEVVVIQEAAVPGRSAQSTVPVTTIRQYSMSTVLQLTVLAL